MAGQSGTSQSILATGERRESGVFGVDGREHVEVGESRRVEGDEAAVEVDLLFNGRRCRGLDGVSQPLGGEAKIVSIDFANPSCSRC